MDISEQMLAAAMKTAVETGILKKSTDAESYLRNWDGMKQVLEAALKAAGL